MSGDGGSFLTDAFHQIAIAADRVRIVIDNLVSRPVVARRKPRLRNRQAQAVGESLPKWPGGDLDAGGQATLGMTRRFAPPLSEMLDLLEGQVVTGKIQQAVQQHRPMSSRQYETITVEPLGVPRIMLEKLRPKSVGHGSGAHRHAG